MEWLIFPHAGIILLLSAGSLYLLTVSKNKDMSQRQAHWDILVARYGSVDGAVRALLNRKKDADAEQLLRDCLHYSYQRAHERVENLKQQLALRHQVFPQ